MARKDEAERLLQEALRVLDAVPWEEVHAYLQGVMVLDPGHAQVQALDAAVRALSAAVEAVRPAAAPPTPASDTAVSAHVLPQPSGDAAPAPQPASGAPAFGAPTSQPQPGAPAFGAPTSQPQPGAPAFGAPTSQPQPGAPAFGAPTSQPQATQPSPPADTAASGAGQRLWDDDAALRLATPRRLDPRFDQTLGPGSAFRVESSSHSPPVDRTAFRGDSSPSHSTPPVDRGAFFPETPSQPAAATPNPDDDAPTVAGVALEEAAHPPNTPSPPPATEPKTAAEATKALLNQFMMPAAPDPEVERMLKAASSGAPKNAAPAWGEGTWANLVGPSGPAAGAAQAAPPPSPATAGTAPAVDNAMAAPAPPPGGSAELWATPAKPTPVTAAAIAAAQAQAQALSPAPAVAEAPHAPAPSVIVALTPAPAPPALAPRPTPPSVTHQAPPVLQAVPATAHHSFLEQARTAHGLSDVAGAAEAAMRAVDAAREAGVTFSETERAMLQGVGLAALGGWGAVPQGQISPVDDRPMPRLARHVLAMVDGARNCQEVLAAADTPQPEGAVALAFLRVQGAIRMG